MKLRQADVFDAGSYVRASGITGGCMGSRVSCVPATRANPFGSSVGQPLVLIEISTANVEADNQGWRQSYAPSLAANAKVNQPPTLYRQAAHRQVGSSFNAHAYIQKTCTQVLMLAFLTSHHSYIENSTSTPERPEFRRSGREHSY